jgi:hypothetical protein
MKNMKHRLLPVMGGRFEGEPLPELPMTTSPPSPTSPPCAPPREGSGSPPGLWVCGGNTTRKMIFNDGICGR